MARAFIPNSEPWISDAEIQAVTHAMRGRGLASNEDNWLPAIRAVQHLTGAPHVLLTTSCTSAMELALACADIKDQEVILPSFTFSSTATSIIRNGGKPVFVDIEEDTLNLDLSLVPSLISEQTKAIMPVHYAGVSCDMDTLMHLAKQNNLKVIEDAAHALGASYKGRALGTIGDFGCFSFHYTKNYICGEGGALLVQHDDDMRRAEVMYDKGTNRSAFMRGEVDKYTWVSEGSSYVLSPLLSTLLEAQLARFTTIKEARKHIVERYQQGLKRLSDEGHIRFIHIPEYNTPIYHLAYFVMREPSRRDALLKHLKEHGVGATFHYIPLHSSPYAQKHLGTRPGQYPVTERIAESIVRLPLYPHMEEADIDAVIDHTLSFFHPEHTSTQHIQPTHQPASTETLDLSLIIPCYNDAPHLHKSLDEIIAVLEHTKIRYEIILIEDCGPDDTRDRIEEYVSKHRNYPIRTVFHQANVGRGGTVTEGIEMARGTIVGFIDIDLEIPARYIPVAIEPLRRGSADVVLADRTYKFQSFSLMRLILSLGYRKLVQWLLHTSSMDTEAGFKFFRKEPILPVLKTIKDTRWFWDTEVCVRSVDAGLRMHQEPVLFVRKREKASTVHVFGDSYASLVRLLRFRAERQRKHYNHS
jgi:dTDP-4-amino-4,6-dideoxygalactose transaminase